MKKKIAFTFFFGSLCMGLYAQNEDQEVNPFTVSLDIVNRYNWRGTDFGNNPHFQPGLQFEKGGIAIGAWGSYSFLGNYQESDLFMSYALPFGLLVGVTDYYFPSGSFDSTYFSQGHYLELNGGYSIKGFSLSANVMLGTPAKTNDIYVELGYYFKNNVSLFVGAGNEAYTSDSKFMVCITGVKLGHSIKITEQFSLPVFGSLIINPQREQVHLVAGINF